MTHPQAFILAGHGGKDPGAMANGVREADLTREQQALISEQLKAADIPVFNEPKTANLNKTIAYVKKHLRPGDLVVDLHFNAATPLATGTEVYYRQQYTPRELTIAQLLSKRVAETLGIIDRGAKPESWSQHAQLGILHTGAAHSLLIETCFISHTGDLESYQAHKHAVAATIAKTLIEHLLQPHRL